MWEVGAAVRPGMNPVKSCVKGLRRSLCILEIKINCSRLGGAPIHRVTTGLSLSFPRTEHEDTHAVL